ncbi:MAG: hypothetical protein U0230_20440 [Polyangiales bacterium]
MVAMPPASASRTTPVKPWTYRRALVLASIASFAAPMLVAMWIGRGDVREADLVSPFVPLHPTSSAFWMIPFAIEPLAGRRFSLGRTVGALVAVVTGLCVLLYLGVLAGMGWNISGVTFAILCSTLSTIVEACVVGIRDACMPRVGLCVSAWLIQFIGMSFGRGWMPSAVALVGGALLVFGSAWNRGISWESAHPR